MLKIKGRLFHSMRRLRSTWPGRINELYIKAQINTMMGLKGREPINAKELNAMQTAMLQSG
jgi:hypothetical protein